MIFVLNLLTTLAQIRIIIKSDPAASRTWIRKKKKQQIIHFNSGKVDFRTNLPTTTRVYNWVSISFKFESRFICSRTFYEIVQTHVCPTRCLLSNFRPIRHVFFGRFLHGSVSRKFDGRWSKCVTDLAASWGRVVAQTIWQALIVVC